MKLKSRITIGEHFKEIEDPRIDRTKLHNLMDIITIAICAVICGSETWEDIEEYGKCKHKWLKRFLKLPHGIPSHDTFSRVFARINPEEFQTCFINWVQSISKIIPGDIVAIDGKTLRHSYDKQNDKAAIHMISAWSTGQQLVLGQRKIDNKSNEITAIPQLIKLLSLSGCIVSIDAMGCQKSIVKEIIKQEADYIITLKKNQPKLYSRVEDLFEKATIAKFQGFEYSEYKLIEEHHGRQETRYYTVINNIKDVIDPENEWDGLYSIGKVDYMRVIKGKSKLESRYFIISLNHNATRLSESIRSHWQIENNLHWVLDVQFNEDKSRMRKDNSTENFARLRHITLNLLNQENSQRLSIRNKRNKAGWDDNYLMLILNLSNSDDIVA